MIIIQKVFSIIFDLKKDFLSYWIKVIKSHSIKHENLILSDNGYIQGDLNDDSFIYSNVRDEQVLAITLYYYVKIVTSVDDVNEKDINLTNFVVNIGKDIWKKYTVNMYYKYKSLQYKNNVNKSDIDTNSIWMKKNKLKIVKQSDKLFANLGGIIVDIFKSCYLIEINIVIKAYK